MGKLDCQDNLTDIEIHYLFFFRFGIPIGIQDYAHILSMFGFVSFQPLITENIKQS